MSDCIKLYKVKLYDELIKKGWENLTENENQLLVDLKKDNDIKALQGFSKWTWKVQNQKQ